MGNKQQTFQYAVWREDIPQKPGYSKELISLYNMDDPDSVSGCVFEGCTTIWELFQRSVRLYPICKFLGTRNPNKEGKPYEWKTYREAYDEMDLLARGIDVLQLSPSIEHEDKQWRFMGVYSKNRQEWALTDLACMRSCITIVPFYESLGHDGLSFIINQTLLQTMCIELKYIDNLITLKKERCPSLQNIVVFDSISNLSEEQKEQAATNGLKIYDYNEIIEAGKNAPYIMLNDPTPDTIKMFAYTSGTTGDPKAAMLQHSGFMSMMALPKQHKASFTSSDVSLSYLPYAHMYEQIMFTRAMSEGMASGYYSGDPLLIFDDIQALKPTFLCVVPRILTRVYQKVYSSLETQSAFKKWMFNKAVEVKNLNIENSAEYSHKLYDKVIFSKIRDIFGGNLKGMITGSAAIDPKVLKFFRAALGFPIYEGYGQTETFAAGSATDLKDPTLGHVGGVIPCLKLRLKDVPDMNYFSIDNPPRGEIQLKGSSMFKGYFRNEKQTQEVFTEDGWIQTGDIGLVLDNGALKIIDRVKNIFKLSQGEFIAPEKLQGIYGQYDMISQIFVYGDSFQSYLVAIVVPDMDKVSAWAKSKGIEDIDDLDSLQELKDMIMEGLRKKAEEFQLTGLEKIKKIHLTKTAFTPQNGLVTPTMKVKRNFVKEHFDAEIRKLYESE